MKVYKNPCKISDYCDYCLRRSEVTAKLSKMNKYGPPSQELLDLEAELVVLDEHVEIHRRQWAKFKADTDPENLDRHTVR